VVEAQDVLLGDLGVMNLGIQELKALNRVIPNPLILRLQHAPRLTIGMTQENKVRTSYRVNFRLL